MRRPAQLILTNVASGRVSMPFLPTLAVVAVLGVASLYCTPSQPTPPEANAELAAPSPTAFAPVAIVPDSPRRPAALAFAEAYPLAAPSSAQPAAPVSRPAMAGHPAARLSVASRRPCAGRRCPETPLHLPDPLAAAHAEAAEPDATGSLPAMALPFADAMADRLAPAARVVGDAAVLLRDGAAAVQGSVAMAVAECLR